MLQRRYPVLLLVLWVVAVTSACGSREPQQPSIFVDENLERVSRAAHLAFGKGEFAQAASLYRETLEYAYARDDREMIVDTQYNLAIALLRLGALEQARVAVESAKRELARASQPIPAHLQLLDATLLFHAGQVTPAWAISEYMLADPGGADPAVLARLHVLRGLIAAERGDISQLRTSLAALEAADLGALNADRAELKGRLDMAEHNWGAAVDAFVTAAALQQEALDYPNMVRSLAMAGEASMQMKRLNEATIFLFRAGRSAVRLDMANEAQEWLNQAQQLALHTGNVRMSKDIVAQIETLKSRPSRPAQ